MINFTNRCSLASALKIPRVILAVPFKHSELCWEVFLIWVMIKPPRAAKQILRLEHD